MKTPTNFLTLFLIGLLLGTTQLQAQDTLPFREPPSASTTGKTLADSKHQWRTTESHLPADSPNIVIFMTDDAGFANASTFGGPINTPTLDRLAATGISYNEFHTTAMCSPTRASLLTGRNYHRVGAGQIAELAADWDGYVGKIPKSTTTFAQVLSYYGYNTAAFGKWHNTPVTDITRLGPFDRYPTGMGFDYFYGFLAGETSQYEPALFDNPEAPTTKKTQYFEIMGSRGIYHEGWFAGVFGPRTPWSTDMSNMMNWNPETDEWELYNLEEDYSQSKNLAKEIPEYAEGVLFALGGISSGFTVYMDKGFLKAEYNAMTLNRYKISSESPVAAGKVKIEVETLYDGPERLAPGNRYSEDQWKTSWTGTH